MAVLYFTGEGSLPSGKIPDGIFLQAQECAFAPGSRFLPCAKGTPFTRANKNIASPFKSLRRQSSLPASPETKNLLKSRFRAKKRAAL